MLLFLVLYGIVTFGAAFYVQQAISRAAEDGARAASLMPQPTPGSVCQAVSDSLARTLAVPTSTCTSSAPGRLITVSVTECSPVNANCAVVRVTYRYKDNPILPSMSLFDTGWVPEELQSSATVALKAS